MTIRFITTRKKLPLPSSRARSLLLLVLCLAVSSSQMQLHAQRKPKTGDAPVDEKTEKDPNPGASGSGVDPNAYRIGPEDQLSINVWHEPDLSGKFSVRPDGKIMLPLAGEVTAGDTTPAQLTKIVAAAYGKLVNNPEVMVQVERVLSKKFYLVGEVNRSGMFPLVVPTKVMDAINAAGGLREFANDKNITIIRGDKRIKFNYREVIRGKHLEQNIFLESGDSVVVR